MAISKDLLLAILSMDSYNRGYNQGINGLGGVGASIGKIWGHCLNLHHVFS